MAKELIMAEVIHLHPRQPPLAGYLRVGHNGHRKLEHMLASGRLQYRRFVFDASYLAEQGDLLRVLQRNSCEIVLDPNFAEMFFAGKFGSSITRLPWANHDRPWTIDDFLSARNFDVARAIAEFAIKYGVDAVLAPSHLIGSTTAETITVDFSLCRSLRKHLDLLGGSGIKIDFQLSLAAGTLADGDARQKLLLDLHNLPVDNIWIRVENFGATSTGVATRTFIESVRDLHSSDRPIVLDYAGGLVGLSALSFSATGGICHGIGIKEKFDISRWKKAGGSGGGGTHIYIAELDRYLKPNQLSAFWEAKGSKSKFSCNDPDCCKQIQDMIDHHDEHFVVQRSKQLSTLSKIPFDKRVDHFMLNLVGNTVRMARAATALKIDDPPLLQTLLKTKKRLQLFEQALVDLNAATVAASSSRVPAFRGGSKSVSAVLAS
jgi:hypothetical protein